MISNWFKKPSTRTSTEVIVLNELWSNAHAHLTPLKDRLDFWPGTLQPCACCKNEEAIRVRANLQINHEYWLEDTCVNYCYGCCNYYITVGLLESYAANAKANAKREAPASEATHSITAVNARLWAASPTVLNIEPTTRCNFNCWYCIGRTMVQADIDFDGFTKALEHFPELEIIAIVGEGEPLLHKQFFDMVHLSKQKGLRVVTISNGSPFSESVVKKLCESGIDYISISIDSVNPDTFASSRIDGDLEKVWANIKRLADYRDANGYRFPLIGLKGTLFEHTRDELPRIASEAKKHGVDLIEAFQSLNQKKSYVEIYPSDKLHLLSSASAISERISEDMGKSVLPHIGEFAAKEGLAIRNDGGPNGIRLNCNEEWIYSLLSGDVTPCCQIKKPIDDKWNIFKYPINQILSNPHYQNIRFNLWNGIFLPQCQGCSKTCGR